MRTAATNNGPVSTPVNPIWMRLAQAVVAATATPLQQLNGPMSGQQSRPAGQAPFFLPLPVLLSLYLFKIRKAKQA